MGRTADRGPGWARAKTKTEACVAVARNRSPHGEPDLENFFNPFFNPFFSLFLSLPPPPFSPSFPPFTFLFSNFPLFSLFFPFFSFFIHPFSWKESNPNCGCCINQISALETAGSYIVTVSKVIHIYSKFPMGKNEAAEWQSLCTHPKCGNPVEFAALKSP